MAAVYVDLSQHVEYIILTLEQQIEQVERLGEDNYNQLMISKVGQVER
jgi:hypothetical protein